MTDDALVCPEVGQEIVERDTSKVIEKSSTRTRFLTAPLQALPSPLGLFTVMEAANFRLSAT